MPGDSFVVAGNRLFLVFIWYDYLIDTISSSFQCPVTYDIVGDGKAVYLFAVNATSGWIRVVRELTDDTALSYTVCTK